MTATRHRVALWGALLVSVLATTPIAAEPIVFEDRKPKQLICDTKALDLSSSPFKETTGGFTLALTITGSDAGKQTGTWTVTDVDKNHTGSFAVKSEDTCAKSDCVLRVRSEGSPELWAPKPMSLDKLGKDERLTLVVIEAETLKLKGTVFVGNAPDVLENGTCNEPLPDAEDASQKDDAKQTEPETTP